MNFLFHGKRKDNGEWVEGYYFKTPLTDEATGSNPEDGWSFLTGRERHCISKDGCVYEVLPETVEPHIGLTDKNNKKIYNGDIVSDGGVGKVEYVPEHAAFLVFANDEEGAHYYMLEAGNLQLINTEVVGNIHDNPELLTK